MKVGNNLLLLIIAFLVFSCSDSTKSKNEAPIIKMLLADPLEPNWSQTSFLTAIVDDADGDDLLISWLANDGSFSEQNANTTLWTAPDYSGTFTITVIADDGEDIATEAYLMTVSPLTEDFSFNLNDWQITNASASIINDLLVLTGTNIEFFGTAVYQFPRDVLYPWTAQSTFGRVNNVSNGISSLVIRINDIGDPSLPFLRFDMGDIGDLGSSNWQLLAFLSSPSTESGWFLLDGSSFGSSALINSGANGLNNIAIEMTESKRVNIFLNDQLFYTSTALSQIESDTGSSISVGLESVQIWSYPEQVTQVDWITVRDVGVVPMLAKSNPENRGNRDHQLAAEMLNIKLSEKPLILGDYFKQK